MNERKKTIDPFIAVALAKAKCYRKGFKEIKKKRCRSRIKRLFGLGV